IEAIVQIESIFSEASRHKCSVPERAITVYFARATGTMFGDMATGSLTAADLRNAIERREVLPYFQPIVELRTGQLRGFEVLARWRHSELGIVSPDQFLHLAESEALIDPLFDVIVEQAFLATPAGFPRNMTLSINVAPVQMRDRSVASRILSLT